MREVQVRAVVTDPWDSPVPQLLVSWQAPDGKVYGARLPLKQGIPEPLPKPLPPDPIKVKFPDLTDEDVRWMRQQLSLSAPASTPSPETER